MFFDTLQDFFINLFNFDSIAFYLLVGFAFLAVFFLILYIANAIRSKKLRKLEKEHHKHQIENYGNLTTELSVLNDNYTRLENENKYYQETLENTDAELKKVTEELDTMKMTKEQLVAENEELKVQKEELENSNEALANVLSEKAAMLDQHMAENEALKTENAELTEKIEELTNKADRIATARDFFRFKLEHLKAENKALLNVITVCFEKSKNKVKNATTKVVDKSKTFVATAKENANELKEKAKEKLKVKRVEKPSETIAEEVEAAKVDLTEEARIENELSTYDRSMLFKRAAGDGIKRYIVMSNKNLRKAIIDAELKRIAEATEAEEE